MADPPVLAIKLGALGDVVQSFGALADIAAHHAPAPLIVLTRRAYAPLIARAPFVAGVLTDPQTPRWRVDVLLRLRRQLRAYGFARAYDLQNSGRSQIYCRLLAGVPVSGRLPGATFPAPHDNRSGVPALARLAAQLRSAAVAPVHTETPDVAFLADTGAADAVLSAAGLGGRPFVLLVPGSSARGAAKRWPHYAALAARLRAAGRVCATAPGPGEEALCAALPATMLRRDDGVLDLFSLAGVMQRAAFVIGNDTGPMHLASHLGRPGLVLFGPHADAARTSIARPQMQVIAVPDLAALDPDRVAAAVLDHPETPIPAV